MNSPLLRSTPSQSLPGFIPYWFGAASNPRFIQLGLGMSWGIINPDSVIFSLSLRSARTGQSAFSATCQEYPTATCQDSIFKNQSQTENHLYFQKRKKTRYQTMQNLSQILIGQLITLTKCYNGIIPSYSFLQHFFKLQIIPANTTCINKLLYHTKVHFFPHLSLDLKEDSDRHPNIFPS